MNDLTDNEKHTLAYTAVGLTIQEVATVLHKSPHTVRNNLVTIRRKLHAHNTTHAVAKAVALKII